MKVSLNWLKEYVEIPVSDEELVKLIGARLVEVEGVIDETHKYDNIFVVRVESAEKIPETHLTLCQINDGGPELVQVVCGAPNVREGMLAAWIKPGAIVPASVHEGVPFVIGKRKMLGKYESNGMLAGADELDFGDKHEKIAEIDPGIAKPGDLLADVFDLRDSILEIENKSLTHRPDTFGIIGFAREISGILGQKFKEPEFLCHEEVFPEGFLEDTKSGIKAKNSNLVVEVNDKELCPRYTCGLIKVVEATERNQYLSKMEILLAKSGMHSVSKIVDVTNYLMLLTGQPLHAFDYDKFLEVGQTEQPRVIIRRAKPGEKLELLDETVVECTDSDILITSNDVPVALAGAMGGKNTEIDENTKNVLLESASFSLYNLRKTQMVHGIFSEAITRFTKGVPVGETFNVLAEAIREINGKPLDLTDVFPGYKEPSSIKISTEEINSLLGTEYDERLIVQTLSNVGFEINSKGGILEIVAPIWRTDIHIKEDIIEEVGRLLGYDNIQPALPLHATAEKNSSFELKRQIRDLLARLGANEVLTYSFVSEKLLEKAGQAKDNSYKIINSISPELQYVRQSIVPSLLEKAYVNEKLPVNKFAIFEMNKAYRKEWGVNEEKVPVEKNKLGFVIAERKFNDKTAFYQAKKYAARVLDEFGIVAEYLPMKLNEAEGRLFEPKRSAEIFVDGEYVGVVGEFKNSIRSDFKLSKYLAGFEVDLDLILAKKSINRKIDFAEKETRDLTLATKLTYGEIVEKIQKILTENDLEAKIEPVSIYQADNTDEKHISVHLEFKKFNEEIMKQLEELS